MAGDDMNDDNPRGGQHDEPEATSSPIDEDDDGDREGSVEYAMPSPDDYGSRSDQDEQEEEEELDETHDSGTGVRVATATATAAASFVAGLARVEESEAMDVPSPTLERGVNLNDLGPVEELDTEIFEIVEKNLNPGASSTTATREVIVCKFCLLEFPYMVRDLHLHKDACMEYQKQHGKISADEMETSEDPSLMADLAKEYLPKESDNVGVGMEIEFVGRQVGDEDQGNEEEEGGDDDTQVLDDTQATTLGSADESSQVATVPGPRLKVASAPGRTADQAPSSADTMDIGDTGGKGKARGGGTTAAVAGQIGADEDRGHLAEEADRQEEQQVVETASEDAEAISESGENHVKDGYRFYEDSTGKHAECSQCGKICAARSSGLTAHSKKCPGQKQPVPTMTPKKKAATKRRTSFGHDVELQNDVGEFMLESGDDNSLTGSTALRRSKRLKTDVAKPGETTTTLAPATLARLEAPPSLDQRPHQQQQHQQQQQQQPLPLPSSKRPSGATATDEGPLGQVSLRGSGPLTSNSAVCNHCKAEMPFRVSEIEKHLASCDAYKSFTGQKQHGKAGRLAEGESKHHKKAKPTTSGSGGGAAAGSGTVWSSRHGGAHKPSAVAIVARRGYQLGLADIAAMDANATREWIFGSMEKAEEAATHYRRRSVFVVRGPIARFQAVKNELYGLDVKRLLDQVLPSAGAISAMIHSSLNDPHGPPSYHVPSTTAAQAWYFYQSGLPISFPCPKSVAQAFVGRLAADTGCGSLVTDEMHDSKLVCTRKQLDTGWKYLNKRCFVVCLQGKLLWKVKPASLEAPVDDFPSFFETAAQAETHVKLQLATLGVGSGKLVVAPPTTANGDAFDYAMSDDEDVETDRHRKASSAGRGGSGGDSNASTTTVSQLVVEAGSVVYLPAGTWFCTEPLDRGALWLQIELKTVSYGDLLLETMRQLVWARPQWREPIPDQLPLPGGDKKDYRQHLDELLATFRADLHDLKAVEMAPDLLVGTTEGCPPAKVVVDADTNHATKCYEFDLADGFTGGKNFHFLKGSMFRVNPLAVLLAVNELPDIAKAQEMRGAPAGAAAAATVVGDAAPASSSTTKKALNRKHKKNATTVTHMTSTAAGTTALAATSTAMTTTTTTHPEHLYLLHVGFGNAARCSRVRVKFHCSAEQQSLIDWVRSRDTKEPLHVGELAKVMERYNDTADMDVLKMVLRFLCTAGYLTMVEVPL